MSDLSKYCVGNGLDIGHGGVKPLNPNAICLDRPLGHPERNVVPGEPWPTHLVGDAGNLRFFNNGVLDYVYSSHVLEDFQHTGDVLWEWLRVIRTLGFLVLVCPDQAAYESYCYEHCEHPNEAHKIPQFSLQYVKTILHYLKASDHIETRIVHEQNYPIPGGSEYSWELVIQKL